MIALLHSPIGLDVGANRVRAIQLARRRGGWRIAAATAYPRHKPEATVDAEETAHLARVLGRQGFAGDEIVSAVPGDALLSGIFEVPAGQSGAPREQIARMELARMHEVAPDRLEINHWELPRAAQARAACQVMAAGYAHGAAEAYLDAFEASGLTVTALDVRSCALVRACRRRMADTDRIYALLDVQWTCAMLSLVHQDVIVYDRRIAAGGLKSLHQAIGDATGFDDPSIECLLGEVDVTDDTNAQLNRRGGPRHPLSAIVDCVCTWLDATIEEVRTPLSYVQHEYPRAGLGGLLLLGQAASIRGMSQYVGSVLGIEVGAAAPRDVIDCPPPLMGRCSTELTAALGYSLFGD